MSSVIPYEGAEKLEFIDAPKIETLSSVVPAVRDTLSGLLLCFVTHLEPAVVAEVSELIEVDRYIFDGRGTFGVHVDEPSDQLAQFPNKRAINAHRVISGTVHYDALCTRPGFYYQPQVGLRHPASNISQMIERDLTEGKFINGLHASPEVYRGTLQSGETLYFAERTGTVEDGPNVLHRFYWGSTDRLSEVTRYRERSA